MVKYALSLLVAMLVAASANAAYAGTEKHEGTSAVKAEASHPYKEVSVSDLEKMMKDGKVVVLDTRGGKWFDGEGIQGAKNLPADQITKENLAKVGVTENTPVAFYCTNEACPASKTAAHKAAELGFKNLYKLPVGIEGWKKAGKPTEKLEAFQG